jgi:hypothetical protein
LALLLVTGAGGAFALSVTTTNDATALANTILGTGVTITSVSLTGATTSQGTFTDGSVIGIDSGIILTSGDAADAVGPNSSDGTSTSLGLPGSTALNALIPQNTLDAVILDITFTTTTGDLFFNYVFASEEYNEFVDSFNDVFAFFLDGVAAGDNIALIPGTTDVVSIDNINLGDNATLYNNNDPDDFITPPFNIEYDGFTDVLTAQALGLSPGSHTLSIQIADAGDSALDSAVFIEGGSFSGEIPTAIPEPGTLLLLGFGLSGAVAIRRKLKG